MSLISTTNKELIEDLEERSKTLVEISNNFAQLIKERDRRSPWIEIACYFEGLPTYNIGFIVDKASATLPGIAPVAIEKNHASMPKFDGDFRPGFIKISDMLFRWIQDLDEKAAENQKVDGINIGETHHHAPITNNPGVVAASIFSTKKHGLRVTGAHYIYNYGEKRNLSALAEDGDSN